MLVRVGDALVIYSAATGRLRRWLVPDADGVIQANLLPGEASLLVTDGASQSAVQLQVALTDATGLTPDGDRYVIIDRMTGLIQGAIIADPLCGDALPGCDLFPHPQADATWIYSAGILVPPVDPILPPKP